MSLIFNSLFYTIVLTTPIVSVMYKHSFSKSNIRLLLALSTVMITLSLAFVLVVFFGQRLMSILFQGVLIDINGFYLQIDTSNLVYGYILFAVWMYAFYVLHQRYTELVDG